MILFKKASKRWFYDEAGLCEDGTTLESDVVILVTSYDDKKKFKPSSKNFRKKGLLTFSNLA